MSAKTLNIIGCNNYDHQMPNKLELVVGYHGENNLSKCSGCISNGLVWNANDPRPIFLTITNFQDNDKSVSSYCLKCSTKTLDKLIQDLVSRVVFFCPCHLCSFDTMTNTQKPQDLMNSSEPITICLCALPRFNLSGKLSQGITDYQNGEYIRRYKYFPGIARWK